MICQIGHHMFVDRPSELMVGDVFIRLKGIVPNATVHLKIEGFSSGGSIKAKTARHMFDQFEARVPVRAHGMRFIESSSGNLGLALALIAAERGHRFTCVTDPNISSQTRKLMLAVGAEVVVVDALDQNGGFLGTRIAYIHRRLEEDPGLIWLNQYANPANAGAHLRFTGPEIFAAHSNIDFLFVGAGTTGTLGGVSRYARLHSPQTRIIAVDSVGSVTFGAAPGKRYVAGLGTSARPAIADDVTMDALEMVEEAETIVMCRRLAAAGLLVGGSTGTVLSAVARWSDRIGGATVVAIAPDLGDRYADSIYDNGWVEARFPGLLDRCQSVIAVSPPLWD